jgi:signal transduction histidine kinase
MSDSATTTLAERAIYRGYDQQRRLALVRGIAPGFAGILALFVIILNIDASQLLSADRLFFVATRVVPSLLIADPIFAACVGCFILALLAARRGNVRFASGFTIIGTNVAVITIELMWSFGLSGFDYVAEGTFAALSMAIVLAGMIGGRTQLILTTLLMNSVTLAVGIYAQVPHPAFAQDRSIAELAHTQQVINLSGAVLVQWAFAVILLSAAGAYGRIMRELGDVRVAYERAKQLDELKDQFISSVNHELRNPVMAMQGYLELLSVSNDTAPPDKRQALLKRAISAADNLAALLGSILDARRLDQDAADFVPEVVNVRDTIGAAAELIDPREGAMVARDLAVSVPAGLTIWGEHVRLQQILTNLISNALKYSDPGTPVEISARPVSAAARGGRFGRGTKSERQMVEIVVRDYGLGVPPEQAPLLFQRFVRLPRDLASTTIGNGLGLYLCKVLAQAMGGRIWVQSSGVPGQGSAFHVVLPMPSAEQQAEPGVRMSLKRVTTEVPASVE